MNQEKIIQKTANYVRQTLEGEGSGHDWWHIKRVWNNAIIIGGKEEANMFVVQMAALLHDIADFKFHGGDTSIGPKEARGWLDRLGVEEQIIANVCDIIANVSFKGAGEEKPMKTKEGKVVRDADRLDALGAIGIARCFAYGGHKGHTIHNPEIQPKLHETKEDYLIRQTSQINHFYEKLLLLKDLMQTETGKKLAESRHQFMEAYLKRFFDEWEAKT